MLNILIFAVIVTSIVIISSRYKKMDTAKQRKTLWRLGTGMFLGLLAILVVTGRMHWIGAAIGAMLPFLRIGFSLLLQALPFWLKRNTEQPQQQAPVTPSSNTMNSREALEILGFSAELDKDTVTEAMVLDAHRRLIQKLHPDRGGNDYLAAKINQARDLLINKLNEK